jgi:squalene-hopene/tetraprenyl-beta-curcumene cyclase
MEKTQAEDGSWVPLWFGNQFHPQEHNPVYGTARVLLAYRDYRRLDTPQAQRGLAWLCDRINPDGGWGGGPALTAIWEQGVVAENSTPSRSASANRRPQIHSSVEETALAVESLLAAPQDERSRRTAERGLAWLVEAVNSKHYRDCSPIGFYFAKLWYYEKLYPLIFTASALGEAIRRVPTWSDSNPQQAHPLNV